MQLTFSHSLGDEYILKVIYWALSNYNNRCYEPFLIITLDKLSLEIMTQTTIFLNKKKLQWRIDDVISRISERINLKQQGFSFQLKHKIITTLHKLKF